MSARGSDGADLAEIVTVAVISFSILFIGVTVLSPVIETTGADASANGTDVDNQTVLLDGAGTTVNVPNAEYGENETVLISRGHAVRLAGTNDSYVESDAPITISSDDTWTVSVGASVNSSATGEELTAISLNGRLVISYNRTVSEWRAWYYDESDRQSYNLSVPGANQPGSLATVQVVGNGTHVTLYRDNTVSDAAQLSGSGDFAAAPVNNTNWYGRLDELRLFDDNLTSSERQELVDSPVDPLKGTNRTARVMFDVPDGNEPVYFTSASLIRSNVTYTAGYAGREMQAGEFTATGADYAWSDDGPTIRPLSGGELDGAPAAYISYTGYTTGSGQLIGGGLRQALILAGLLPVLLVIGYIAMTLQGVQGRR